MPVPLSSLTIAAAAAPVPFLGEAADASLADAALALLAAYVLLVGPGQAWWRGIASGTPRLFARVAISVLWTTLAGLALAVFDSFSLPRLAVASGAVTLLGYLFVARVRLEGAVRAASRGFASAIVVVVLLTVYWPPFETHMAASDSTTYTAAGIHLAHARHLWKRDPLVEKVPQLVRNQIFFSVLGAPWKPPYARMPGGLVIETQSSDIVRPAFFPIPIVWSALFADAIGARYAGGFAPLFAALAAWAFWIFARRRLDATAALIATGLVAFNAASYWSGRFALAEPIASFFLWAGLVALDAYEDDGFPSDARLAGVMLAAAGMVRLELLPFLLAALMLRYLLRADLGSRPLTPGFAVWFLVLAAAAPAQAWLLPGAYAAPVTDTLQGIQFLAHFAWNTAPWLAALVILIASVATVWSIRRLGIPKSFAVGVVVAFVAGYLLSSAQSSALRSLGWLSAYLGPLALVLAAAGALSAWRKRFATPGDGFFVILAALTTGLLLYAPHVYPTMPWASRRFVPLVVPALLLWAVSAAARTRRRWSLAGTAIVVALVASVLWPARAVWRMPFYERSYDELQKVAENLPSTGTLLIDNRLIPLLLSPPLWLAFDRNSLPVDTSTLRGRQTVAGLVHALGGDGPLYLLKPSAAPSGTIPFVLAHPVRDFEVELALPEQTPAPPPRRLERYVEMVSVVELSPWKIPPSRR